jgi:nitrous oxidase accessory protein NosD
MRRAQFVVMALVTVSAWSAASAAAGTLRVPAQFATIQEAVDTAAPGDEIRVGPGEYCGAVLTKPLTLRAEGGATIVGCAEPHHDALPSLRIGFFLNGTASFSPASGTTITGFTFDGLGVSNENTDPLTFAIFARFAHHITVTHNRFVGTIQAVTNTGGDRWQITHNRFEALTLLTCDGFCGGGDAIVIQSRQGDLTNPVYRAEHITIAHNDISGAVPDGHDAFSMVGVLVLIADNVDIANNRVAIPDNPASAGAGEGIVLTNLCCGSFAGTPGVRAARVVNNDGRGSQFGLVVESDGGANLSGAVIRGNFGVNLIEDGDATVVRNRSIHTVE